MKYRLTILSILMLGILNSIAVQAQNKEEKKEALKVTENKFELISKLDAAAEAHSADSAVAGVSVAVVHKGDTLLMDGYGLADLEFDVPMPKDAVFEIGSVTKQFTAAAILQLAGEDSLDLDDNINKYLPDYNTRGHTVTIRQLMHHTSGLRSYTTMSSVLSLFNESMARDTLLTMVEHEPFRFAPGTAMSYSNTGYFLLGLIIEEASGQSYESYIAEHIFDPAAMEHSYYCNEQAVNNNKAHGYDRHPKQGIIHKRYYSHMWPYSAGSLCSSAPDLLQWNRKLHGGEIIPDSLYRQMVTPGQLDDGTKLRYGMGLRIYEHNGRTIIGHGGGIAGYISESRYYPDQDLIIIALQNTTSPPTPQTLADSLAKIVLGEKEDSPNVAYSGNLNDLTGRYTGPARGRILDVTVKAANGNLILQRSGSESNGDTLRYVSNLTWERENDKLKFVRFGDQVAELRLDVIGGHYVLRRIRNEF